MSIANSRCGNLIPQKANYNTPSYQLNVVRPEVGAQQLLERITCLCQTEFVMEHYLRLCLERDVGEF